MPPQEFSVDDLRDYTSNFDKELGSGNFGAVYQGEIPHDRIPRPPGRTRRDIPPGNKIVAVKRSKDKRDITRLQWMNERQRLGELQHKNIIELIGYAEDGNSYYLVYEYLPLSVTSSMPGLKWDETLKILKGAAAALKYIHEYAHPPNPPLVHGDFKMANLMMDEQHNVKLCDFGTTTQEGTGTGIGTKGYEAPEARTSTKKLTPKADVYSFGVVMLQLLAKWEKVIISQKGKGKGKGKKSQDIDVCDRAKALLKQKKGKVLASTLTGDGGCSPQAEDVITKLATSCTGDIPKFRPSMSEVLDKLNNL